MQASTIVRFAKAFGYDGASRMQRLFRDELINSAPNPSYAERIRQFNQQSGDAHDLTSHELMREVANSNIIALEHLQDTLDGRTLEPAVDLIEQAAAVYLVGLRRSFPVAIYLASPMPCATSRSRYTCISFDTRMPRSTSSAH